MGHKAKRARVHARRARLLGTPEVAPEQAPVVEAAPVVEEAPVVEVVPEPVAEEPAVEVAPEPKRVVKAKKPVRRKRATKKKTTDHHDLHQIWPQHLQPLRTRAKSRSRPRPPFDASEQRARLTGEQYL